MPTTTAVRWPIGILSRFVTVYRMGESPASRQGRLFVYPRPGASPARRGLLQPAEGRKGLSQQGVGRGGRVIGGGEGPGVGRVAQRHGGAGGDGQAAVAEGGAGGALQGVGQAAVAAHLYPQIR